MSVDKLLSDDVFVVGTFENRSLRFEESDHILEALSSETGRRVLQLLSQSPHTISEVAADLDLSVQNVSYHVNRFEGLGLVDAVGTRYSSKGREMTLYVSNIRSLQIQFETPRTRADPATSNRTDS